MKILHVLNYAWPWIDGYTARSIGLINAQAEHLPDITPQVAVSPFQPLAHGRDESFTTPHWAPELQLHATRHAHGGPVGPRVWERPAIGLAPATGRAFRRELASIARRVEADLVHVHHPHYVAGPALEVAAELGLPGVFELRCFNGYYDLGTGSPLRTLRGRWQNHLDFELAREASAVVTIADGLAAIMRRGGVPGERISIVRNSVDTNRFSPDDSRGPFVDRVADADGLRELHVGYATTFERIENLDEAVRAAGLAAPELARNGIRLVMSLAGTGRDHARIKSLVEQLELTATVRLPGLVPYGQMPDFYRSLDLFLVPRGAHAVSMDTTPLKPLEALACGLPLIVTDLPAMRELLAAREDVRFSATSANAMSEALIDFARSPFPGAGPIPERAWPLEVQRYADVYAQAIERGPPRARARRGWARAVRDAGTELQGDLRHGAILLGGERRRTASEPLVHLVVCGYPRSGSTLLQLMLEHGGDALRSFDGEVEALDVLDARVPDARLLTKHPDDLLALDRIRDARRARGQLARFALTVRDPRDVLTSRHAAYPAGRGYYVDADRFARSSAALLAALDRDDVAVVRYESLVDTPAIVSERLGELTGWPLEPGFGDWFERARASERDSMTEGALGGLRRPDPGSIGRWRDPAHRERIETLIDTCPVLMEVLVALRYEPDDRWVAAWREGLPTERHATTASGRVA